MTRKPYPPFGPNDVYLFREGTHNRLYDRLGAHLGRQDGQNGCFFAVWAPNARRVSVIGDFNDWDPDENRLELDETTGVWGGFVPGVGKGALYKFRVISRLAPAAGEKAYEVDKSDPFAFFRQQPPETASVVWDLDYDWQDEEWSRARSRMARLDEPWSIYEVHLGSWKRRDGSWLSYRELADELAVYVKDMAFTHVELLPVMEHPYYPSWGYQVTGYFAPTSRYGVPQDFMYFVDRMHREDIGVILDWVPSHFPSDAHGLGFFDGTYLYEHADPRRRIHPDWDSLEFNYNRGEVSSFLLSSGMFWLDRYHVDALRVDAVASMLYLDYSRKEGGWEPNRFGGRENLDAIEFLRRFNLAAYGQQHTGIQTIAEESTAWPMVSHPTYVGGLGFGMKWDMGFMHDTLAYFQEQPRYRKHHQDRITFRPMYAFSENFVLPLSHDEVVHGKGSLLLKMPGDDWQRFANLRLLLGYMWGQPGKKLLFMGGELGARREWAHDESLEWFLLEHGNHLGIQSWVRDLNRLYREYPALHQGDCTSDGFEWINCQNTGTSVLAFLRKGSDETKPLLVVYNFSTKVYHGHRLGVPRKGHWKERLNSDSEHYGGSGQGNLGGVETEESPCDDHPFSVSLTVPALAALFFEPVASRRRKTPPAGTRAKRGKAKKT